MSESEHDQSIRERAYELWERAGKPADRNDQFWHQAREQIPHPPEPPPALPEADMADRPTTNLGGHQIVRP